MAPTVKHEGNAMLNDVSGEAISSAAWLAVKAVRDIAIGLALAALLIDGAHRQLAF
jgi:hypothetical protein